MATAQLLPVNKQQFRDANGNPLVNGQLFSYAAGTTTPQATYTDKSAVTPNTNPVILDSNGMASVWLRTDLAYKIIIQDSSNNVIWTADNISIVNAGSIDNTKIAANIAGVALAQNNGTLALDVQVDNSTISVSGSNKLQVATGGVGSSQLSSTAVTTSNVANLVEVVVRRVRDLSNPGLVEHIPQYEWSSPSMLSNPGTLPAGAAIVSRWSPNGEFLAVGNTAGSPIVAIYQRVNGVLTKLSDPASLSTSLFADLAWSPCGDFLAIAVRSTSSVQIFQRSNNSFTLLTTLSLGTRARALSFSPNGDFLAIHYQTGTGPYVDAFAMYERSGTTFNNITSTSTISGVIGPFSWSPDSYLFAALNSTATGVTVYTRSDNVFTSIGGPTTTLTGTLSAGAFSPDGKFLALIGNTTPYIQIFTVSGTTFTAISNPGTLPAGAANCLVWSANGEYLALGVSTTPFIDIYSISGTTFTKVADPSTLPAASVSGIDWSSSKRHLAVASGTTPYIQVYQTASTIPANGIFWTRGVTSI